jgi:hypothetical protein
MSALKKAGLVSQQSLIVYVPEKSCSNVFDPNGIEG